MVSYNFHPGLARDIIEGRKAGCLKPHGARAHVAVGGVVTAYIGNVAPEWTKSPDCHRLLDAPCVRSAPILVDDTGVALEGRWMTNPEFLRMLAVGEGAVDFVTLQYRLRRAGPWPWRGQYIRWNAKAATYRADWPLVVKPPGDALQDVE